MVTKKVQALVVQHGYPDAQRDADQRLARRRREATPLHSLVGRHVTELTDRRVTLWIPASLVRVPLRFLS